MIIWHVFIFNYVEFTQGKLRIARDTTVNDYLCCKGVKGAKLGPIFHTQFGDKWHVWFVGLRRRECKLFISSVTCSLSPNQWIILLTMRIFEKASLNLMSHNAVTTPGTLRLLLARTTPGPQRSRAESRRLLLARDYSWPVTPALHDCCRIISGCLKPTNLDSVQLLAGIAPPHIRRTVACRMERTRQTTDTNYSITNQLQADWTRGRASCAPSRRSTRLQAAAGCSSGKTAWQMCHPLSKWDWR